MDTGRTTGPCRAGRREGQLRLTLFPAFATRPGLFVDKNNITPTAHGRRRITSSPTPALRSCCRRVPFRWIAR
jgi:hypothetical protein